MHALIELSGKQYKVEEGSSIKVPYINGKVGSKVTIDKILYLDDGKNKSVGTPLVNSVNIAAEIESHGRERKVVVFKFKRRKGYQKKNTHRQEYTILKVGKFGPAKKSAVSKKATTPATKKTVAKKEKEKKITTKKAPIKKTTKTKEAKE